MRIHHQIEESNERHTKFTLFIDGIRCGHLWMLTEDVPHWFAIVRNGASLPSKYGARALDEYVVTGTFFNPEK